MIAPVTHILPQAIIRRELLLPKYGRVFVRTGQMVKATDVLAEVNLEPEFQMLDIARLLHVPKTKAEKVTQCWKDDRLSAGDLIAGPVGIARRLVRARRDCRVILAADGQVLIEIIKQPYQLKAGMPGEVVRLIPERGATVETRGALVQALWGNGLVEYGPLHILGSHATHPLRVDELRESQRGKIVLAGYCGDLNALKKAEEMEIHGIILGGMEADLLPSAIKLSLPVILIEGFGNIPINPIAYKLLASLNGKDVAINAYSWDPYFGKRPEIVIPTPADDRDLLPQEIIQFAKGQTVRLLRAPYQGQIGVIAELVGKMVFPGGGRDGGAVIEFEDGGTVSVPLSNVEIIA